MLMLILRLICAWLYSFNHKIWNYNWNTDKVAVIIPTYNEKPELLHDCIASVLMQRYDMEVIVVDDGSTTPVSLSEHHQGRVKLIRLNENQGKMRAQAEGIYQVSPDTKFILTVDSDTTLGLYAIDRLLKQFDDETGAVCGQVEISNIEGINWIVQFLYWNAFNIWRGGSSFFNQVMVCSGAISMYRLEALLKKGKDGRTLLQEYLDRNIEVGNDRFMTFLLLREGWKTRYEEKAIALTDGPTGWRFVKQQVRWNKSFWRGIFYSWPVYSFKRWYFTLDMMSKAVSRILTMALFVSSIVLVFKGEWETLGWIGVILLFYGLLHSVAGIIITRRPLFALFAFWGVLSLVIVAPVNIWSIITVARDKWETR